MLPAASFMINVAKGGSDTTGNGTDEKPYLTIAKAMSVAATLPTGPLPDTFGLFAQIYVGSGTYTENVVLTPWTALIAQDLSSITVAIDGTLSLSASWATAAPGITGVALSVVAGFTITGDATFTPPGAVGAEVFFYTNAIAGNLIVTGNTNAATNVGIYSSVVDSSVFVSGSLFFSTLCQLGTVSIASTVASSALWQSTGDQLFGGTISADSTAGNTVTVALTASQGNEALTLTGAGTTYTATAGGIPSTVTLAGGAAAPVALSPLVGLNSKKPDGTNAAFGATPKADGNGGITWV